MQDLHVDDQNRTMSYNLCCCNNKGNAVDTTLVT